jgi:hypothetical protein
MTMTPLLTQADTGTPSWADVPALATCSYRRYRRDMGTAVRITRGVLRGVSLPDPAYTDRPHWPAVRALFPGDAYFHKGLTGAEFRDRYVADLNDRAREIEDGLMAAAVRLDPAPAAQRLVLLCFEVDVTTDPLVCHRRMFASWWAQRTGRDVPELGVPAPC